MWSGFRDLKETLKLIYRPQILQQSHAEVISRALEQFEVRPFHIYAAKCVNNVEKCLDRVFMCLKPSVNDHVKP